MIFVTVGTQKIKFTRLFKYLENITDEDKKIFEKYINEYKDTAKEREITIYFNMLQLAIDTILIYYNTNGAKKSIEKVIKYIIKEYFFYLIY